MQITASITEKTTLFNIFVSMHDNLTKKVSKPIFFKVKGYCSGTTTVVKCFLILKFGWPLWKKSILFNTFGSVYMIF